MRFSTKARIATLLLSIGLAGTWLLPSRALAKEPQIKAAIMQPQKPSGGLELNIAANQSKLQ